MSLKSRKVKLIKQEDIKIRKPVAPPQKAFVDKSKYSRKSKHKKLTTK